MMNGGKSQNSKLLYVFYIFEFFVLKLIVAIREIYHLTKHYITNIAYTKKRNLIIIINRILFSVLVQYLIIIIKHNNNNHLIIIIK